MWKVKTGEQAPLWCMLHVLTQSYGKWFMSPIIVHQSKDYFKDLQFNIPLNWTVHHTSYGYMDRDVWIKPMTQFSNLCGTSPFNNQTIFFYGNGNHFDGLSLIHMEHQNNQLSVLKSGESVNN